MATPPRGGARVPTSAETCNAIFRSRRRLSTSSNVTNGLNQRITVRSPDPDGRNPGLVAIKKHLRKVRSLSVFASDCAQEGDSSKKAETLDRTPLSKLRRFFEGGKPKSPTRGFRQRSFTSLGPKPESLRSTLHATNSLPANGEVLAVACDTERNSHKKAFAEKLSLVEFDPKGLAATPSAAATELQMSPREPSSDVRARSHPAYSRTFVLDLRVRFKIDCDLNGLKSDVGTSSNGDRDDSAPILATCSPSSCIPSKRYSACFQGWRKFVC